ncbi:PIN domain-containing protein [Aurantimonas marianensis]|uniref:Type II toxin-antitoxin system VapC family toxin n=1 Tax=Aurantimonas marianensis TaxID=2920428 RepID=A0A9X2KH34_9HYPH|nr:type II toxin-antitoxin system VapC family toxin [Aurantimonas marianensis]MCP3054297.1 type II toxin-antitoxin system VapC family toxin [Aurantimonas marianensis]
MNVVGIDTNVLLRALLNDDSVQSPAARRFLSKLTPTEQGFVGVPVILELFWVLRTRYQLPRNELSQTLFELLEAGSLIFEDFDTIVRCLSMFEEGNVDFSDAVIAERHHGQGCARTVTFDRNAARDLASMELLT